jgi:hypothetical protein
MAKASKVFHFAGGADEWVWVGRTFSYQQFINFPLLGN